MKRLCTLLMIAAILASASALAGTGQHTVNHARASAESNHAWKGADSDLAKFYKSYEKQLNASQIKLFTVANEAWSRSREAFCTFYTSGDLSGSKYPKRVYPILFGNCMIAQAARRLHELQALLVSPCHGKGNVSCPALLPLVPNNSIQRTPTRYAGGRR